MSPGPAAPSATYRLQISEQFTLRDAVPVVGYLARLGVGALYLSPLLRSSRGSTHGYDVVDHALVDPARGGRAGLEELAEACGLAGIELVVDIVPNHMGVADPQQNKAWWELLRVGPAGEFAPWFDVDWAVADGRVLIPVLADDFEPERDLSDRRSGPSLWRPRLSRRRRHRRTTASRPPRSTSVSTTGSSTTVSPTPI